MKFPKLEARFEAARKAISDAVEKTFPVGTKVKCVEGAGRTTRVLRGTVHRIPINPHYVYFTLATTGSTMRRHYSLVELDN